MTTYIHIQRIGPSFYLTNIVCHFMMGSVIVLAQATYPTAHMHVELRQEATRDICQIK